MPTASSTHFSRRNLKARGWGCPSVGLSSKVIRAGFGLHPTSVMGRFLTCCCQLLGPPAGEQPPLLLDFLRSGRSHSHGRNREMVAHHQVKNGPEDFVGVESGLFTP